MGGWWEWYAYIVLQQDLSLEDVVPLKVAEIGGVSEFLGTPTATIFKSYELGDTIAPEVASFSSRGPNPITREILKPDLIAPGVDIITSWPPTSPVSEIIGDNRQLKFNIISRTSMACPYVSGAAGYIKSFHPMWSHVAIHSALMTTATLPSPMNKLGTEFAWSWTN